MELNRAQEARQRQEQLTASAEEQLKFLVRAMSRYLPWGGGWWGAASLSSLGLKGAEGGHLYLTASPAVY